MAGEATSSARIVSKRTTGHVQETLAHLESLVALHTRGRDRIQSDCDALLDRPRNDIEHLVPAKPAGQGPRHHQSFDRDRAATPITAGGSLVKNVRATSLRLNRRLILTHPDASTL